MGFVGLIENCDEVGKYEAILDELLEHADDEVLHLLQVLEHLLRAVADLGLDLETLQRTHVVALPLVEAEVHLVRVVDCTHHTCAQPTPTSIVMSAWQGRVVVVVGMGGAAPSK